VLFGVVYFAQGMWYLPNQAITIILKDRGSARPGRRLLPDRLIPWVIKPCTDSSRTSCRSSGARQSYFLLTSAMAGSRGSRCVGRLDHHGQIGRSPSRCRNIGSRSWTEIGGKRWSCRGGPLTFTMVEACGSSP